ncbi:MAG: TatD family hydrolase, partial [Clostridia bacterium]|nr:TatD family hydrolase [Clostridia bacterium]
KNAPKLTEVCKNAPLDRLLVETDCPYMAPVPLRGRRNEPAFVKHVLLKLAEIKGIDPEYAAEQTWQNGLRAFKMEN